MTEKTPEAALSNLIVRNDKALDQPNIFEYRDFIRTHGAHFAALAGELAALRDLVTELLASHPVARSYPDGPCIEKEMRADLVVAMQAKGEGE